MTMHTLRRRMSALGAVLGLAIGLPLTTGATPAHAVSQLNVKKSHEGSFVRGGQGIYHITISNTGTESGSVHITDTLPQGLTMNDLAINTFPVSGVDGECAPFTEEGFVCDLVFGSYTAATFDLVVDISADAPCGAVTNTVNANESDNTPIAASDTTTITGTGCGNGGGGGGGDSILPVNLNGVVTLFNNVSTNNNLLSPGATNATNQNLGVNAP
ncbi:hypothetical protein ACGFYU_35660 [Streptomyces sp. NPDC048337]|uniref:hypothetical protein n=1 Tax=Streptomyces sp. NPDC048337 TaxID=3365535 RepID=UPI0037244F8C